MVDLEEAKVSGRNRSHCRPGTGPASRKCQPATGATVSRMNRSCTEGIKVLFGDLGLEFSAPTGLPMGNNQPLTRLSHES